MAEAFYPPTALIDLTPAAAIARTSSSGRSQCYAFTTEVHMIPKLTDDVPPRLILLIETTKLQGINSQHYLVDLFGPIGDHPARHIGELLPWRPRACRRLT